MTSSTFFYIFAQPLKKLHVSQDPRAQGSCARGNIELSRPFFVYLLFIIGCNKRQKKKKKKEKKKKGLGIQCALIKYVTLFSLFKTKPLHLKC
jgi:hypothetical protein